jgi:hypothetical protein
MRRIGVAVLLLSQLIMPVKADFLLNCRLMTHETKEIYQRHCKWETVVKCKPGEACLIKRQNFVSGYGNSALSANPGWLGAVSLTNPDSGIGTVAGVSRPLGVEGASSEILATGSDVGRELSGAVDSTAQTATGVVQ